jgi:hypothetical protein
VYPGVKARLAAEPVNRAIRLSEDFKEQVVRILVIRGHIVNQRVDAGAILLPEQIESPSLAVLGPADQCFVVRQVLLFHGALLFEIPVSFFKDSSG